MTRRRSSFPHLPLIRFRVAGCALALLAPFAWAAPAAHAGDLADVKARGKLVLISYPLLDGTFVGVDVDAMRKAGGQLKDLRDPAAFHGIDIDLAQGFAASLGVKLEVHPVTKGYDALIPALAGKEGDLVASSFSITAQRQASADFSQPYVTGWVAIAVPLDSKVASLSDLRGKTVAVMHGSSQLERVQALDLDLKIQLTDFALQNYVAVSEGQADFTLIDSYAAVGQPVSTAFPGLKVAARLSEFNYGMAVRKGSDLLPALNAYLEQARKSGELDRIVGKYQPEAVAHKPAAK